MKTLSYSKVKYTPGVSLILRTVEKVEHENFDFLLLLLLLSSSFLSCITQKVYGIYERSALQTTALLSDIIYFLVRVTCELRSGSYSSKHTSRTLFIRHFVLLP